MMNIDSTEAIEIENQIHVGNKISIFRGLQYVPVFAAIIFSITCIAPFITSIVTGRHYTLKIPTISESAREFPGSRVFNIGSTIAGVLVAFSGLLLTDIPTLLGPSLPRAAKILPFLIAFFFVFVSGFGLDDNVFVHLTCALVGFFSIITFSIFIYAVFDRLRIIEWKSLKLVSLITGAISLALLAVTWPQGNIDPIGSIKSMSEFIFVFSFTLFVLSWYSDLGDYELVMRFLN